MSTSSLSVIRMPVPSNVLPDPDTLGPIELARLLHHLTSPKHLGGEGMTQSAVAALFKRSDIWVRDWRRMLQLPENWQRRLHQNEICQSRALFLLRFNAETMFAVDRDFAIDPSRYSRRADFETRVLEIADYFKGKSPPKSTLSAPSRRLRMVAHKAESAKPSYRLHKASGLAVVRLKGKDHYLGKHNSAESLRMYDELVEVHLRDKSVDGVRINIADLSIRYVAFVEKRFQKNGSPTSHADQIGQALQHLVDAYGSMRAADFSPVKLKAVRDLIANSCVRNTANKYARLITGMFEWAVSEELLPEHIHRALQTLKPMRKGEGRSNPPVKPVPMADVLAIESHVPRTIWGMVRLQLLTAARPGEICVMRLCDIRKDQAVWVYHPQSHKGEHHEKDRPIFIGPKAQAVIAEFATEDLTAYLFPPSKNSRSGRFWCTDSYRNWIRLGCIKAAVPHWHPHQLRHNAATAIRQQYGVETVSTILGHSDIATTEIYAERNLKLAYSAMEQIG